MEKGELIGQGRTADVYAWGGERILKLYQEQMAGHLAEQEFSLTRAAQAAGIPVPAAEELVQVDGRAGIIFERVAGPSMLKALSAQPWRIFALARQLAELHARIHAATLQPGLLTQRQQIERGIQAAVDLPPALKGASLACLAQLPEGDALCHGDFHPDNIILTGRGPVIIDWMTATRGNPLGDVCRSALLMGTSALPPAAPWYLRLMVSVSRRLVNAIYVDRYLQIHPTSRRQIDAWLLPLMAARLREVEEYPQEKELLLRRITSACGSTKPGSL